MAKILEFNETNGTKFCVDGDHLTRLRLLAEDGVKIDDSVRNLSYQALDLFLKSLYILDSRRRPWTSFESLAKGQFVPNTPHYLC